MSLFGGEKIISVASTVYNLAGEEKDRPQFLQTLLMRNVLSGTKDSIGTTIQNAYLNGPSMRLRQFFKWARKPGNYSEIGMPTGKISNGGEITPTSLHIYIPHPAGTEVWCQHALVGNADFSYWADEWIMEHRPAEINKAWKADYNQTTKKITIRFPDNSQVIFTPTNFVKDAQYVYAYYILVTGTGTNDITFSNDQMFIYRVGSGIPGLDALARAGASYGEFFPFIPARIDNRFIVDGLWPKASKQAADAYQKATGGHFNELIKSIADNDQVHDIDYAYIVFGVSLNVVEMACKRYLYTFFDKLRVSQIGGVNPYNDWLNLVAAQRPVYEEWRRWKARGSVGGHDQNQDPEPPRPTMSQLAKNEIRITGKGTLDTDYDVALQWSYIDEGRANGLGRPGAKKNDCWIVWLGDDQIAREYFTMAQIAGQNNAARYGKFRIYLQRQETFENGSKYFYTYLDVVGAQHQNYIYEGKSVLITAYEALNDKEESGFIIPLHYETWRDTPIIDSSQMGTACVFIVFNSYDVQKTKWYQSGIFRIFLVIIIAIVSVVLFPGGVGLLGAHLTVGAAMGFTGLTAAIVGSVVNALAALVLMTVLEKVAGLFGVWGPIIAAILGIFVGGMISSFSMGGSFTFDWMSMFRADNLLKLTDAVGGSVQQMMAMRTEQIRQETVEIGQKSEEILEKIEQAYLKEFGYGQIDLNPYDVVGTPAILTESPATFLGRTTLLGSDVAEMSQDIIHNFTDYSLKLPDAFV